MNLLRIEKGYINISSVCMVVSRKMGRGPKWSSKGKAMVERGTVPQFFRTHPYPCPKHVLKHPDWLYRLTVSIPQTCFLSGPLVSKFLSHSVWNRLRKGAPKIFIDRHSAHYFVKHLKTPNQLVTSIPLQTPTIKVAFLNQGPNLRAQQAFEQCYNLLTSAFPNDLPGRLARVAKPQKEGGTLPDARRGGLFWGKSRETLWKRTFEVSTNVWNQRKRGRHGSFEKRGNVFGCKRWIAKLNLWGRYCFQGIRSTHTYAKC